MQSDSYSAAQAQTLKSVVLQSPDGANVLPLLATAVDALGNNSEFSGMLGAEIFRSDLEDVLRPLSGGKCPYTAGLRGSRFTRRLRLGAAASCSAITFSAGR